MSKNLVDAGHTVRGYDPVPAAVDAAKANGIEVFDSGAAAVSGADVVITMLPNGDLVKTLLCRDSAGRRRGNAIHRQLNHFRRRCP